MFKKLALLFIACSIISSCSKDDNSSSPSTSSSDLMPLAVGNYWVHAREGSSSLDTLKLNNVSKSNWFFSDLSTANLNTYYAAEDVETVFTYRNDTLCFGIVGDNNECGEIFKFHKSHARARVDITLPLGKFTQCYEFLAINPETVEESATYYFKEGVGVVKVIERHFNNYHELDSSIYNLVDYKIN